MMKGLKWIPEFEDYTQLVLLAEEGRFLDAVRHIQRKSGMRLTPALVWYLRFQKRCYILWGEPDDLGS